MEHLINTHKKSAKDGQLINAKRSYADKQRMKAHLWLKILLKKQRKIERQSDMRRKQVCKHGRSREARVQHEQEQCNVIDIVSDLQNGTQSDRQGIQKRQIPFQLPDQLAGRNH